MMCSQFLLRINDLRAPEMRAYLVLTYTTAHTALTTLAPDETKEVARP